jgi:hypothetical protein
MSEYTPGPWKVDLCKPLHDDGSRGEERLGVYTRSKSNTEYCWVAWIERERSDADSNARLISAAPDLFEAIEKIAGEPCEHSGFCCHVIARAAVAKARGEAVPS